MAVVDAEEVVRFGQGPFAPFLYARALRFTTLQQHASPPARRRIQEDPECVVTGRGVLWPAVQTKTGVYDKRMLRPERRAIALEREDLLTPLWLRTQSTHPQRLPVTAWTTFPPAVAPDAPDVISAHRFPIYVITLVRHTHSCDRL